MGLEPTTSCLGTKLLSLAYAAYEVGHILPPRPSFLRREGRIPLAEQSAQRLTRGWLDVFRGNLPRKTSAAEQLLQN